jgi:predicted DNA-binding ribbon-helix-helix protein
MLRDLARNVFHGSVLADIAETSGSMINFASFAKAICAEIGEASLTDDLWKSFKDKAAKQGHIDFRKLMVKLYDKADLT